MASFKLYLDTRSPRKDGTCPIKIAIHHKKSFLINLKAYTIPEHFINNEVIIPGDPHRQKNINQYIKGRLVYVENNINKLTLLGQLSAMGDDELKSILDTNAPIKEDTPPLLRDHFLQVISQKVKPRTQEIYRHTFDKIAKNYDLDTLLFSDINISWLKGFEAYLSETSSINTRAIHLRNLRAVFNDAIDEEVIDQNTYPFRKFKIKKEKTQKRSLTVDELRILRDYPCEPHMERYRDVFMLIFYLVGINTVDLFPLTEIRNGRIEYRRAKTGRLYSIKIEPEAIEIINKYKGDNYLLDVLDSCDNYRNFAKRLNNNLKKIGVMTVVERKNGRLGKKEYQGLYPDISTYWARHTWATIAASLEVPKETIAAALGHGGNSVTDIYIDFDQTKIDKANRKVLDFIKSSEKII